MHQDERSSWKKLPAACSQPKIFFMKAKLITSAVFLLTGTAFAQDDMGGGDYAGDPAPAPTYSAPAESGDDGGGEEMVLGVGANWQLTGDQGAQLVLEMAQFHVDIGIALGFQDGGNTEIGLSGMFWYHLRSGDRSDFSIGGGLGFSHIAPDMGDSQNEITLGAGAQLRAWLTSNVAVSASVGFFIDPDPINLQLGGQGVGTAGLTYFFR